MATLDLVQSRFSYVAHTEHHVLQRRGYVDCERKSESRWQRVLSVAPLDSCTIQFHHCFLVVIAWRILNTCIQEAHVEPHQFVAASLLDIHHIDFHCFVTRLHVHQLYAVAFVGLAHVKAHLHNLQTPDRHLGQVFDCQ